MTENGWDASAEAWLAEIGEAGDFARRAVLDAPMLSRVRAAQPATALDVGCGEGRFCRMLAAEGVAVTGLDPTERLIAAARRRDSGGLYVRGRAEALPFADASFDLVASYLSLIDIDDHEAAIAGMVRVLRPGGRLLVANLSGLATAAVGGGWAETADGRSGWLVDRYAEPRAEWAEWRAMRIRNWHRPLAAYMAAFLGHGLELRHFAEPLPDDDGTARAARYRRIPLFTVMEWEKHGEAGARSAAAVARSSPQPLHDRAATDAPTITLAPYETCHREAVLALCVAAWTPVFRTVREDVPGFAYDAFYPEGWERRQARDVAGLLDADPDGFLLAMAGERLAGFVGIRLHPEDGMGEVLIIAVRPEYQRQRLGRRLMQAAESRIAAAGLTMVMVETVADRGHAPARRLYEIMGYERWPVARYMKRLSD